MREIERNKKVTFLIIGIAIFMISLVGLTYTLLASATSNIHNIIKVNRVSFKTKDNLEINLTNANPVVNTISSKDNDNYKEIVVNITGDTVYSEGIEYLIMAYDVKNTINSKKVPISFDIKVSNGFGKLNNNYFNSRGSEYSIYKALNEIVVDNNDKLMIGYIANGLSKINETLTITAYLDTSRIDVSDIYLADIMDSMEDNSQKVILTNKEWDTIKNNGVSFKIKVIANNGIWFYE